MPSPKSGSAGSAVAPAAPDDPKEADKADPGQMVKPKADGQQGDEGEPHKKDPKKKSWIEIELVDEENKPVPGEAYKITLPDGKHVASGTLDHKGFARVAGIDSGN